MASHNNANANLSNAARDALTQATLGNYRPRNHTGYMVPSTGRWHCNNCNRQIKGNKHSIQSHDCAYHGPNSAYNKHKNNTTELRCGHYDCSYKSANAYNYVRHYRKKHNLRGDAGQIRSRFNNLVAQANQANQANRANRANRANQANAPVPGIGSHLPHARAYGKRDVNNQANAAKKDRAKAFKAGYNKGYNKGYDKAFDEGYDQGYSTAMDKKH